MEEVGVDPEEKPHCYSDVTAVGGAGIRGGEDEAVGILMEAVGAADLSGSDSDAGEEADDEILPLDTSEISRDPTQYVSSILWRFVRTPAHIVYVATTRVLFLEKNLLSATKRQHVYSRDIPVGLMTQCEA